MARRGLTSEAFTSAAAPSEQVRRRRRMPRNTVIGRFVLLPKVVCKVPSIVGAFCGQPFECCFLWFATKSTFAFLRRLAGVVYLSPVCGQGVADNRHDDAERGAAGVDRQPPLAHRWALIKQSVPSGGSSPLPVCARFSL